MFDRITKSHLRQQQEAEELAMINEAANEIIPSDDTILSEDDELSAVDADSVSDTAIQKVLSAIDGVDDEEAYDESLELLLDDEDLDEE